MDPTRPMAFACLLLLTTPFAAADLSIGPSAPPSLNAAPGPGPGAITLSWGAASSLTGVTGYNVYRVASNGSRALAGSTDSGTLRFTDARLGNGVKVAYVVTAVDATGEGPASPRVTATTFTPPSAPREVAASPGPVGTVGSIVVSWRAPASNGGLPIASYHVYRDGKMIAVVPPSATSFTDERLDLARDHLYSVSAVNAAGEGPQSEAVCAMASPWGFGLGEPKCL